MGTVLRDRFVLRLREKRGFMYSGATGIVWHPKPHAAEFVGSTNVAAAKADSALGEWLDILRGVRTTNPVTAAELENARLARTGYLWTGSDGADSVATRLAELARDGLPPSFLNAFASGIGAITPADVSAAAARYIDTDHLAIVVSGDRKVLEPALRSANIAPIVIVDRDGRPIS
jgi:predicted Zn-dependent peptidase